MKKFRYIWLVLIAITAFIFTGANYLFLSRAQEESGRLYRIEINRVCQELEKGTDTISLEAYPRIKNIVSLPQNIVEEPQNTTEDQQQAFFQGGENDYVIRKINGIYYRIEYETELEVTQRNLIIIMNLALGIMALIMFSITAYISHNLISPFHKIREIPYELSKGNLTVGLKENKNRFFGKFIWGLDLLRENLEENKKKELEFQQEKQTLILSISHDIKTPLSAIKLYAGALTRNLYHSEEKQKEIAENINKKADDIESFVSEIVKASQEDFLKLEVKKGEFYLEELINEVKGYYEEKLELLRIPFSCEKPENCLIKGDLDRAVEICQNIMENAIKYGDGRYIRIEMSQEEDCQLLVVKNSGCSLKKEEIPHVFDSFWRGSNTENQPGSGLGLYICRQLIQKMDGDIYARMEENEMQITVVFRRA